jgi:hypothetical protein
LVIDSDILYEKEIAMLTHLEKSEPIEELPKPTEAVGVELRRKKELTDKEFKVEFVDWAAD